MRRFTDRLAGQVHEGLRLQRQCLGTAEDALGQFAVEPLAERLETVLLGDRIDRHEADVMPLPPVLGARIAQSDEEQHERSEERRVGKEGVSTCRSRWSPYN